MPSLPLSDPGRVSKRSPIDEGVANAFARHGALASDLVDPADRAALVGEIVLAALPLAESLARRYYGRGADPEDLLQVARLGLVKAAQRYRPGAPGGFSAYAVPTITGEIKRHFRDHQWLVRPPRALQELRRQVSDCQSALSQLLGRTVSDDEIALELGVEAELVRAVRVSTGAYGSVDDELADQPVRERGFDLVLERLTMRSLVDRMTERDAKLFWLRFVEGRSQASIARELGVSQMQVSRLLTRLLAGVRSEMQAHRLAG